MDPDASIEEVTRALEEVQELLMKDKMPERERRRVVEAMRSRLRSAKTPESTIATLRGLRRLVQSPAGRQIAEGMLKILPSIPEILTSGQLVREASAFAAALTTQCGDGNAVVRGFLRHGLGSSQVRFTSSLL